MIDKNEFLKSLNLIFNYENQISELQELVISQVFQIEENYLLRDTSTYLKDHEYSRNKLFNKKLFAYISKKNINLEKMIDLLKIDIKDYRETYKYTGFLQLELVQHRLKRKLYDLKSL